MLIIIIILVYTKEFTFIECNHFCIDYCTSFMRYIFLVLTLFSVILRLIFEKKRKFVWLYIDDFLWFGELRGN